MQELEDHLKSEALDIIERQPASAALLELVRWLDVGMQASGERELVTTKIYLQALLALQELTYRPGESEARPHVLATVEAAQSAFLDLTESNLDRLWDAATNSYPYGPGEGCFAIREIGVEGCEPGSGCRSGAGSIASFAQPAEEVMALLRRELRPWLQERLT